VRLKAPIYVSDKVMESGSVKLSSGEDRGERRSSESKTPSATHLDLEVYRDFIESLDILDELDK
jgi:bifunctional DNase/RNase